MARVSHADEAVAFFFYDVPKILLLLAGMIFAITVLRTFFSAERARRLLSGKRVGIGNVLASALGIVTPFCSCSAVPLFIGFVETGIPLGVTFSFLIAAPVINEVALVLLYGMFGWKVAVLYVTSGITIAIITGLCIGRLGLERWVEDFVWQMQFQGSEDESGKLAWEERIARGREAVRDIVQKVWLYVLIGIGIGAGDPRLCADRRHGGLHGQGRPVVVGTAGSAGGVTSLFQCGRDGADPARAGGKGRGARYGACVHDGHSRSEPARDDSAAPCAQAAVDRAVH